MHFSKMLKLAVVAAVLLMAMCDVTHGYEIDDLADLIQAIKTVAKANMQERINRLEKYPNDWIRPPVQEESHEIGQPEYVSDEDVNDLFSSEGKSEEKYSNNWIRQPHNEEIRQTESVSDQDVKDLFLPEPTEEEALQEKKKFYSTVNNIVQLTNKTEGEEVENDYNNPAEDPKPSFPIDPNFSPCVTPNEPAKECHFRSQDYYSSQYKKNSALQSASKRPQTRFIGTVIQFGMNALTVASTVTVLVNALTEGCAIYSTICTDRDAIKKLLPILESESNAIQTNNRANQYSFIGLNECMVNNRYVLYNTNKTVNDIFTYQELIDSLEFELSVKYAELIELTNYTDATGSEILDAIFGPIENTMETLEAIIQDAKNNGFITVAVNVGVRLATMAADKLFSPWLLKSFEDACNNYKVRKEFERLAQAYDAFDTNIDGTNAKTNLGKIKAGLSDLQDAFKKNLPRVSGRMGEMKKKVGSFFTVENFKIKPRKVGRSEMYSFAQTADGKLTTVETTYETVKKRNYMDDFDFVKKYNSWKTKSKWGKFKSIGGVIASALGAVMSIGGDIAAIVMDVIQWRNVRDQMAEARKEYENRLTETRKLEVNIQNQTKTLQSDWINVTESFKIIVEDGLKDLLNTTTGILAIIENADFPIPDIDPNSPIFKEGYYDDLTKENIKEKQDQTIAAIGPLGDGFFKVSEIFRGMKIYAEKVNDYVAEGDSVAVIRETISRTMDFAIDEVKLWGESITDQDVVCTIAQSSLPTKAIYDGYELEPFRKDQCRMSKEEWERIYQKAMQTRFNDKVKEVIREPVKREESVQNIQDQIVNYFTNQGDKNLIALAKALTKKDVLCLIADVTTQAIYDYYTMSLYRDNECDKITKEQFEESEKNALDLRYKAENIQIFVTTCVRFKICNCYSLADVTVDEFISIASKFDPTLKEYCATQPCEPQCIKLQ